MISLVVAAVLLLIHALVCLMLWTLMKLGLLPVRGHMLAVIVLVPLWGPLLVVLLSVRSAVFGEGLKESAPESLLFNDELHRSILVHDRDADTGVVPLEEALIVNDPAYRRRLMLSMLTEEPDAYLAQLQAAKLNDDVEVAHYAATAVRRSPRSPTLSFSSWSVPLRRTRARKTSTNTAIFLVNIWARVWLRGAWLRFSANSTRACLRVAASAKTLLSCAFDTRRRWPMSDRSTRRRP